MVHVTLTMRLSEMLCHPYRLEFATINPSVKFDVSTSTRYEDMIGDIKWGGLG